MAGLAASVVEVRYASATVVDGTVVPYGAAMVPPEIKPGPPGFNGRYQLYENVENGGRINIAGNTGGSLIRVNWAAGPGSTGLRVDMVSDQPSPVTGLLSVFDLLSGGFANFQPPNNIFDMANFSWSPPDGGVFIPPGYHLELSGSQTGEAPVFMLHLGGGWGNQVFQGLTDKL